MQHSTTSPSSPRKSLAKGGTVRLSMILLASLALCRPVGTALASTVPLDFPVEFSRPAVPQFPFYYGETIEITATLNYQGNPFEGVLTDPQLYYQSPGMGDRYYPPIPATQTNNLLKVVFPASAQPGPGRLNCFIGSANENYHTAFVLNLRPSPGASPNSLPLPTPTLDFSTIEVLNSPYETSADAATAHSNLNSALELAQASISAVSNALESAQADLSRQIAAATPADYDEVKSQVATNTAAIAISAAELAALPSTLREDIVTAAQAATNYTDSATLAMMAELGSATNGLLRTELDPTVPSWAKVETPPYLTEHQSLANYYTKGEVDASISAATPADYASVSNKAMSALSRTSTTMTSPGVYTEYLINGSLQGGVKIRYSSTSDANQTTYMYSGVAARRNGTTTDYLWDSTAQNGIVRRSELGSYATTADLADKADANQVATIVNYLEGNDARVIITNYDSQVEMPALSFEQKTGTVWRTIWDEQSRWAAHDTDEQEFRATNQVMMAELVSAIDQKADRAWGFYDSHTGLYAPDGYTWISSPNIAIAGGLAYERHVTSAGAVWLLESNGLVTDLGGETNGFFRVSDDSGNALFEIVKGERRTVGALGDHVAVTNGTLYAHYSVVSAEHPTIYACTNLLTGTFEAELDNSCPCTVVWSGSSGNWTAAVTPKGSTPTVFAKAEYTVGGETYIRHAAATSMEYLILGGVKYQLGTATISGSTVLTLTEAP